MKIGAAAPSSSTEFASRRVAMLGLFLGWTILVILLAHKHVVWRDEVRALSLALQGGDLREMLRLLGDGHPGLWHAMLRGAYWLAPTPADLPAVSLAVALAAAALLAFRSPFGLLFVAVFLAGRAPLYEYSVVMRNYGISMLLMFVFATLYPRYRERGVGLGIVLFLLANCNVHSALLAASFLLFWLLDLLLVKPGKRAGLRNFMLNAAIGTAGIVACAATVYPTANDLAQPDLSTVSAARVISIGLLLPGRSFGDLIGLPLLLPRLGLPAHGFFVDLLGTFILVGSTLGLIRRPAAMIAAAAGLLALSCLFVVVYGGVYRHQALWFTYLVSLYWIARADPASESISTGGWTTRLRMLGLALFALLLCIQALSGLHTLRHVALGDAPESRSRDLALLIESRPELAKAIIVADPDYLVEPLSYYVGNRTYLMREGRFGNIVTFTRHARLSLSLDKILDEARQLRQAHRSPVLILLSARLDPTAPARTVKESYAWTLTTTPQQVNRFLSSTRKRASFAPATSDESFDVYVLD